MESSFIFFFLTASITLTLEARQGQRQHRIWRLIEFDNCKDRPIRPFHMLHGKISVSGKHNYVFNADGINEKQTTKLEKVVANVTKCVDRSRTNCEHLQRLEWKSSVLICPTISVKSAPWQGVLEAFHPPLSCTNPKGPWVIRNMSLDARAIISLLHADSSFYSTQWEIFADDTVPFLCFVTDADFPYTRV